jgi:hypothetical protein
MAGGISFDLTILYSCSILRKGLGGVYAQIAFAIQGASHLAGTIRSGCERTRERVASADGVSHLAAGYVEKSLS